MSAPATSPLPGATFGAGDPRTVPPIVVATTGDESAAVVATASALAARTGAEVVVTSAVEPPGALLLGVAAGATLAPPDMTAYVDAQRARVERQLREASGATLAWPIEIRVDEPSRAITQVALERQAGLVVLGLGRHDLTARLLGDEIALRTVRRTAVPVLAVPGQPMRVPPMVGVVAMDFSSSSVLAARTALELLGDGGTLHLVHAWSRHVIDQPTLVAADDVYERALPGRFARVERELRDGARNVVIQTATVSGEAARQVVAFAASHEADFVAAGKQGHGLFELLVLGRVTTRILRTAQCAVLVTPEPPLLDRLALDGALTGTAESRARDEWRPLLEAFAERNAGRRTRLEVDHPEVGAQTQEQGYALLGATYDPHDHRVALMLGDPADRARHLTRLIEHVTSIAVQTGADGEDVALRLTHGGGQTLLTFVPTTAERDAVPNG